MDSNKLDIQYLEKRLKLSLQENDLLRKENQLHRKELQQLKSTFTNIITTKRVKTADGRNNSLADRFQNEDALRQVLEMQRTRINQLEKDQETLQQKYEKILIQEKAVPYSQIQVNEQVIKELHDLRVKNTEQAQQIKELITNQAKELAAYRTKIAQSDAQLFISNSQQPTYNNNNNSYNNNNSFTTSTNNQLNNGVKKQQSSRNSSDLEPLDKSYQILKTGIKKY